MLHQDSGLAHLSASELSAVADVVISEEFESDASIITEGETGETMYFLEEGEALATVNGKVVREYTRGDFFGEIALLMDQPRKASVKAGSEGARCLMLDRAAFDMFASGNKAVLDARQEGYASAALEEVQDGTDGQAVKSLLATVPLLQNLSEEELTDVADMVVLEEFESDVAIITAGDNGESMYFLAGGFAQALVNGKVVRDYKNGEFFGELALLMDQPRKATVMAGSDGAKCLTLDRGPLTCLLIRTRRSLRSVRRRTLKLHWKRWTT